MDKRKLPVRVYLLFFLIVSNFDVMAQSEEELTLERDSAILSGTLLIPKSNPTESIALFFSGSGPTDRDGNTGPQYSSDALKMLAEGLSENGIASLRFDKRGIGKSEFKGDETDVTFDDFIEDGRAWLELLKEDERFERIYVIGHSQGSLVGALVSADSAVEKFVSIAGISTTADEVILAQLQAQSPFAAMLAAPKLDSLRKGLEVSVPQPPLDGLFRKSIQPFLISWFAYEPSEEMARIEGAVLIVNGTTDIQVSVTEAKNLHKSLPGSELYIVEGMNHALKDAPIDRMENIKVYSDSTKPLTNGLVDEISAFLLSE